MICHLPGVLKRFAHRWLLQHVSLTSWDPEDTQWTDSTNQGCWGGIVTIERESAGDRGEDQPYCIGDAKNRNKKQ